MTCPYISTIGSTRWAFLPDEPPPVPFCQLQGHQPGGTLHWCFAPLIRNILRRWSSGRDVSLPFPAANLRVLAYPTLYPLIGARAWSSLVLPPPPGLWVPSSAWREVVVISCGNFNWQGCPFSWHKLKHDIHKRKWLLFLNPFDDRHKPGLFWKVAFGVYFSKVRITERYYWKKVT